MHFVKAKGILSASNGMNLYRGCSHGCIYCDSRSKCYHMEHDFEDIEIKENAIELLENALRRKRKKCMLGTGSMTDPYIPLESKIENVRKALALANQYGFGFTLITKSDRVLRDLDLLKSINDKTKCVVQMTLTTYDEDLCKKIEPNVSTTRERFEALKKLNEAAKLLVFSDKPIIEIAFIAGYESQQAFSDIFKLMYKKSPGQYRNDEEFYPLQLRYILNKNPMVLDQKIDLEKEIQFASMEDIPKWIELVRLVVDGFPCLDEKQYVEQLKDCIQKKQALILKDKDIAIGIMGITIATGSIDFLGIHPQYRKQGITQAFLKKAISLLITGDEISVTTFREGDKADTGYRNIFKNLGFAEAELLVEFGYPTQRFVLQKENWEETANE